MDDAAVVTARSFIDKIVEYYKNEGDVDGERWELTTAEQALVARLVRPINRVLGDGATEGSAMILFIRWGLSQLRPDRATHLEIADKEVWLTQPQWRPVLTFLSHYGFVPVPDFPDVYYRRAGEPALENLCGLWQIGNSTLYRYLDRTKQQLAHLCDDQYQDGRYTASLAEAVTEMVYRDRRLDTAVKQAAWHSQQAQLWQSKGRYLDAMWHWQKGGNIDAVVKLFSRHLVTLAQDPDVDGEIDALKAQPMAQSLKVKVLLAAAAVYRARDDEGREVNAYEEAARVAANPEDKTSLAIIYSQLGRYYEGRDSDRALAYYQDSLDLFDETGRQKKEYSRTLIRLAWLYVLRNDPRAQLLLEQATALRFSLTSPIRAELEQTWGEYYRRAEDLEKALQHKHRALNTYTLLADQQGVIKSYVNLISLYAQNGRFGQAIYYHQQIQAFTQNATIPAQLLVSADINLGTGYFWQGNYEAAIQSYQSGLEKSIQANLIRHAGRAHYNLAEVYYTRFLADGAEEDEEQGDRHVTAGIEFFQKGNFVFELTLTRNLKKEILTKQKADEQQRLLPQEKALHYPEMLDIEENRQIIGNSEAVEDHIKAYFAIAKAYLAISIQERKRGLALCRKHRLTHKFHVELEAIQALFDQSLNDKEALIKQWCNVATNISQDYLEKSLTHLLAEGNLTKRTYVHLCEVSPTTASKHLTQLTELALLKRVGLGRNTHYILP